MLKELYPLFLSVRQRQLWNHKGNTLAAGIVYSAPVFDKLKPAGNKTGGWGYVWKVKP